METDYIVYYIGKLKKHMHTYLDMTLKKEGITDVVPAYADILTALYINDGSLKMHEISNLVGKDKSTITVLVNRLIERKFIRREKSQLDKRVVLIHLDQRGIDATQVFHKIADNVSAVAYQGFDEQEITQFKNYINRIYNNFSEVINE